MKAVIAKFSWPAHRVVAGIRLLALIATHPGKAHHSVDRRATSVCKGREGCKSSVRAEFFDKRKSRLGSEG
jgi:hypothetical protein